VGSRVDACAVHGRARLTAEVVGFATNSDGCNVTRPEEERWRISDGAGVGSQGLEPAAIGYVNGHGNCDGAGRRSPRPRAYSAVRGAVCHVLSFKKRYLGHSSALPRAPKSMFSIQMMRADWFARS